MGFLEELEAATSRIAERAGRSVVGIAGARAAGSGVVLGEGRVLTNAHNVRGNGVTVVLADGSSAEGAVAGVDVDADLAVVRVETGDAPPIEWAPDGEVRAGRPVFGIANPGGRGLRVTFGQVSATSRPFRGPRGRRVPGGIEHTSPLPRGSSGGPIVDADGRLLGLNTSRLGDGFYVAVPADASLRERVERLSRGESDERPALGIGIAPSFVARRLRRSVGLPERDGLLVRIVQEGSPAAGSGIEPGDLLVEAGGRPVASADDLNEVLDAAGPGGTVELRVVRGAEERAVSVTLPGSEARTA